MAKKKTKEKYLFVFRVGETTIELFDYDMMDAQQKACKVLGVSTMDAPLFVTANWDCPRCRHVETECNYPEV